MKRRIHIFDHLKKYAVYRRALLSYLGLSAVTVLVVSATLFVAFGRETTRDITESGEAILGQTASALDLLKEQVRAVGNALIEEQTVVAALRSGEVDRFLEYRTNLIFGTSRAVYPFIRFVGLYNGTTDRYISTEGLTADVERTFIQRVVDTQSMEFFTSYVRPIDYTYPRASDSGLVVSFVLRPDVRLHRSTESFLLVNVEIEYLRTLIRNLSGGYGGHVFVTTDDGAIVASADNEMRSDGAFVNAVLDHDGLPLEPSSYQLRHDGTRYIVTSALAGNLGWRLYGIRSQPEILSHSMRLLWLTLGVACVIILVGAAISASFTKRIYDPLSRLVEEVAHSGIDSAVARPADTPVNEYELLGSAYRRFASRVGLLEGALHEELPLRRRSYLHSLMIGMRPDLPDSDELASEVIQSTRADAYAVVLCVPDRLEDLRSGRTNEEVSSLLLLLSRAYHESLSDLGTSTPMLLEGYEIALVIGGNRSLSVRQIEERIQEANVILGQRANVTMSCGMGPIVHSHDELQDALEWARRVLRERFFLGPSSVVVSQRVRTTEAPFVPFPARLSRRLSEALRLGREAEVRSLLDEFRKTVRRNAYHGALALYYQLSVELLSEFDTVAGAAPDEFERHRRFVEDLSEVEFATDADRALERLCGTILEVQSSEMADKTGLLYRMACEMIDSQYADPNLSLDSIAGELQVSAGHLGRVFADHAGLYLSDQISRVRIDHAKELLCTTSMNVSDVAESVGLRNATYFFTLFKKHVGITPASFRRASGRH